MDDVYNDLSIEICKELENKWVGIQNDPIIAHSVHDGKKSFLRKIVDSGAEKKSADYCFMILNEAVIDIKAQYGKDVFAICTNIDTKMAKMRELALKEYLAVLTYGCSAYYMSLKKIGNTAILKQIV